MNDTRPLTGRWRQLQAPVPPGAAWGADEKQRFNEKGLQS